MIKINREEIKFSHFNDNTCYFKYNCDKLMPNILWLYENDEEIVRLMYLVNHIRTNLGSDTEINLVMPFLPNARQDRVKDHTDVFTLKYFANFINSLNFNTVTIYDPHSAVSEVLFNNLKVLRPKEEIEAIFAIHPDALVFFPDEGSQKRYKDYIDKHQYGFGIKTRNWETREIESLFITGLSEGVVKGRDILIIDDICGTGETLFKAAAQLKNMGAKNIYAWVSHCENTIIKNKDLDDDLINKIYTSNSIYSSNHPKIETILTFE